MSQPEFIFVTGCNAAGKSSLIRTHLSEYPDFQVIMTDVFKSRSREVFLEMIKSRENLILETPFNNEKFKDLADIAKDAGYSSTLVVLFLETPSESFERVAARSALEKGLFIPEEEVKYNFVENFKNVANYHFYFDRAFFVYTGVQDVNQHVMTFVNGRLAEYYPNDLEYVQRFAGYAHSVDRLHKDDLNIIAGNKPMVSEKLAQEHRRRFRLRR